MVLLFYTQSRISHSVRKQNDWLLGRSDSSPRRRSSGTKGKLSVAGPPVARAKSSKSYIIQCLPEVQPNQDGGVMASMKKTPFVGLILTESINEWLQQKHSNSEASANKHFEHFPCEKTQILAILDTKSHRIITALKAVTTSVDTSVYISFESEFLYII